MLNWDKPLQTQDGRFAMILPGLQNGKRRVCIARKGNRFDNVNDAKDYTTWHYNEDGTIDADTGGFRLRNAA